MYCTYFGFREKPFNITPNPRFIYLSKNHKEAFAHLLYGIRNHAGFIKLTGEVGTGKTTVLRTILEQLDDEAHRTALILNPCLSSLELLRNINREFAIPHAGLENGALLEELNRFLLSENRAGKTVVLVIDEAQNLDPKVLEQIRLISNLETESDKLIQIVLAGQPELNTLLARPELRQLAQRIIVSFHLLPMDFEDSCSYIRHRLMVAGGGGWISFSASALKKIYSFSKGSPRLINILCDRSLLVAFTEDKGEITGEIAAAAIKELKGVKKDFRVTPLQVAAALFCILFLFAVTFGAVRISRTQKADSQSVSDSGLNTVKAAAPPAEISDSDWLKLPATPYPALNELFRLWGEQPATPKKKIPTIAEIASSHTFSSLPLQSIENIITLDTPAIVEVRRKKGEKTRLIAIISQEDGIFRIAPQSPRTIYLSKDSLSRIWTGRGRIIWKNRLDIPEKIIKESSKESITKLQELLIKGGKLKGSANGILDEKTVAAIKSMQSSAGLAPDGAINEKTVLLLNRNFAAPTPPRLQASREKRE